MHHSLICDNNPIRFHLIYLSARVVLRARQIRICLSHGHPAFDLLIQAREKIAQLAMEPQKSPTLFRVGDYGNAIYRIAGDVFREIPKKFTQEIQEVEEWLQRHR